MYRNKTGIDGARSESSVTASSEESLVDEVYEFVTLHPAPLGIGDPSRRKDHANPQKQ